MSFRAVDQVLGYVLLVVFGNVFGGYLTEVLVKFALISSVW